MKLHADTPGSSHYIQRYDGRSVQISGQTIAGPVIVAAETLITEWTPPAVRALGMDDLHAILELEPEVIVLGTGAAQIFPDPELIYALAARGIGLEVMATDAACRTYNVLVSEDRRVVAALLLD